MSADDVSRDPTCKYDKTVHALLTINLFLFLAVTNWNIKKLFINTTLENAIDDKSPIENLPEKNIPLTPIDELDKDMFLHMKNNIWFSSVYFFANLTCLLFKILSRRLIFSVFTYCESSVQIYQLFDDHFKIL